MITRLLHMAVTAGAAAMLSAAPAHGQPPGFPDLGAYQPVDPARYTASARAGGAAYFVTPDGLQCVLPAPGAPGQHVSASCGGRLPGLPPDAPVGADGCSAVGSPSQLPGDLSPYTFQAATGCPVISAPALEVGQKITASDITCVVGPDRLTACIDPSLNRGFVLRPEGSWTF